MILSKARDGNGWILRSTPTDYGLWFDTKESALQWAEGMGITISGSIEIPKNVFIPKSPE